MTKQKTIDMVKLPDDNGYSLNNIDVSELRKIMISTASVSTRRCTAIARR